MTRVTVVFDMDATHGLGVSQVEAEALADTYLDGGGFPGRLIARAVQLEPEDGLTAPGARLMAEDELPGRYARPGLRIVDGDRDD